MRRRLRGSFESLAAERDRLELLLEQLQEGVVAVDDGLRVAFANAAARDLLDLNGPARGGSLLPEVWADLSLRDIARGLFVPGARLVHLHASPTEERTYAIAAIPPVPGSDLAMLVVTDMTLQERRERAEREFVANAAHELRTPIAAITAAMDALMSGAKDVTEDRERFLAIAHRQTARLGRLVRTLLTLARVQTREQALRLEPIEIGPLLDDIAGTLEPAEGVKVEVRCTPGLKALAQRELAEQILINLTANSVRHTERGRIVISARRLNGSVAIDVTDTGAGFPAEEKERVFDRFYSSCDANKRGFGLGLAIVREAVHALGGFVDINSAPGRRTRARISLPAAEDRLP
jgi:two-component system phosphate regulon sensor histidine kinase PhoR